ncbi:class I adenylate-forming enzyme family protein [Hyphomonas sp.]|uniref:class I adenylate-forming enzyme family protein n=1 Tax=Hyphomonas sp. TaxID=87 RepID=UPI00391D566C
MSSAKDNTQGGADAALPVRFTDFVERHAAATPDKPALVSERETVTYREFALRVRACEAALLASGVQRGDRVALMAGPSPDFWIWFLASCGIGAIWVGLNPRYTRAELSYVIGNAEPSHILSISRFEGRDYADDLGYLRREHECLREIVALDGDMVGALPVDVFLKRGQELSDASRESAHAEVRAMDPALIVYTSGSTGKPKGAMLSHFGLCYTCMAQVRRFDVSDLKLICFFPINHVGGTADTCGNVLVAGGTARFQSRFDSAAALSLIRKGEANMLMGVPTMIQMIMGEPDFTPEDFRNLEFILWGGAALPADYVKTLSGLGVRMATLWGLTEATTNVTFTEEGASEEILCSTVGKPLPEFELRLLHATGRPCTAGEEGEFQVRGDYCMLGYWQNEQASKEAFTEDGWMKTGDLGRLREDGNIVFVSRIKEMFKSGGYNVYPREIEATIEEHPVVQMAVVVSAPHPLFQEVGVAFVQPAPGTELTPEELKDFCRERLANYKVPKRFVICSQFPMLPIGKVDRSGLAKRAGELDLA